MDNFEMFWLCTSKVFRIALKTNKVKTKQEIDRIHSVAELGKKSIRYRPIFDNLFSPPNTVLYFGCKQSKNNYYAQAQLYIGTKEF